MDAPTPRGERRRYPRAACDWPVTITLPDGEHVARLRDVSRAGVSFFLDRRLPEMTVLAMHLDLPARNGARPTPIAGQGVVVRCKPLSPHVDHYEVAVFLSEMTEENRRRLDAYVQAAEAV